MGNFMYCNRNKNNENTEDHIINELQHLTANNTKKLFENSYVTFGRVIDIYDGDTCTVIIKYSEEYLKFPVRLAKIDTCEMNSKNNELKNHAILARNRLYNLITNKNANNMDRKQIQNELNNNPYIVKLNIIGLDKYGRLLADIYKYNKNTDNSSNKSFSQILLDEKLAFKYDGKAKMTEATQLYNIVNMSDDKSFLQILLNEKKETNLGPLEEMML